MVYDAAAVAGLLPAFLKRLARCHQGAMTCHRHPCLELVVLTVVEDRGPNLDQFISTSSAKQQIKPSATKATFDPPIPTVIVVVQTV